MELLELLKRLDLPKDLREKDDLSLSDFNDHFEKTFISRKAALDDKDIRDHHAKDVLGRKMSIMDQVIKKGMDDIGMSLGEQDLNFEGKARSTDELLGVVFSKTQGAIKELKETNLKDGEEKLIKLSGELDNVTKEKNTYQQQAIEATDKLNTAITSHNDQMKTVTINTMVNSLMDSVDYSKDMDKLKMKGFKGMIKEDYVFSLDDNEVLEMRHRNGESVYNSNRTDTLSPQDAITKIASEEGMLQKNNTDNNNLKIPRPNNAPSNNGDPREVNKSTQARREELQNRS